MSDSICRMCFNHFVVDKDTVDFDDYYYGAYSERDGPNYLTRKWVDVFEKFTNLRVFHHNDGSPRKLCGTCTQQLCTLMALRSKADESDYLLKNIFTPTSGDDNALAPINQMLLSPETPPYEEQPNVPEHLSGDKNAHSDGSSSSVEIVGVYFNDTAVDDENENFSIDGDITKFLEVNIGGISADNSIEEEIKQTEQNCQDPLDFVPDTLEQYLESGLPPLVEMPRKWKRIKKLPSQKYVYKKQAVKCNECGKPLKRSSLRKHVLRFHRAPVEANKMRAITNSTLADANDSEHDLGENEIIYID